MVGIDPASAGLARAAALGLKTTHAGLAAVIDEIAQDGVAIAFDATSASEHAANAALLEARRDLLDRSHSRRARTLLRSFGESPRARR